GRAQRADRPVLPEAIAVYELFQRRLVSAVMMRGPQRMGFVQRPVVEDDFVHRAGRNEDEARHAGGKRLLEQTQRSHQVRFEEALLILLSREAEAALAWPFEGRVYHRVHAAHQCAGRRRIAERAGEPFNVPPLQTAAITRWPVPATQG